METSTLTPPCHQSTQCPPSDVTEHQNKQEMFDIPLESSHSPALIPMDQTGGPSWEPAMCSFCLEIQYYETHVSSGTMLSLHQIKMPDKQCQSTDGDVGVTNTTDRTDLRFE